MARIIACIYKPIVLVRHVALNADEHCMTLETLVSWQMWSSYGMSILYRGALSSQLLCAVAAKESISCFYLFVLY
jgi:hypothetical protein